MGSQYKVLLDFFQKSSPLSVLKFLEIPDNRFGA